MGRMSRRWMAAGAVIAMLAAGGCASSGTPSDAVADDGLGTISPDTLSVGLDLTYVPYSYLDGDEPVGFDVEVLKALAEELGIEADFQDTRFEQVIIGVSDRKFDVTPGLYITAERAAQVDFVPYFSAGSAIVARQGDVTPTEEMDLCGLKVASIKGGAVVGKVLNETTPACQEAGKPAVDIREYPTDPEATQALLAGGVDVQLTEAIIAKEVIEKTGDRLVVTNDELLYPVQVGFGVTKGNDALVEALTGALERIQAAGTYAPLLAEYNLEPADLEEASRAAGGN